MLRWVFILLPWVRTLIWLSLVLYRGRLHVQAATRAFAPVTNWQGMTWPIVERSLTGEPRFSPGDWLHSFLSCMLCYSNSDPLLNPRCSVEGCPQTFASNGSMKNHVSRVHQQKENRYVVCTNKSLILFSQYGQYGKNYLKILQSYFSSSVVLLDVAKNSVSETSWRPIRVGTQRSFLLSEYQAELFATEILCFFL